MNRYLLIGICITVGEIAWIVAVCLSFHARGYKRGRAEGYEEGFQAGQLRADNWWMELEYETLRAQQIRNEEERWP